MGMAQGGVCKLFYQDKIQGITELDDIFHVLIPANKFQIDWQSDRSGGDRKQLSIELLILITLYIINCQYLIIHYLKAVPIKC